MWWNRPSFAQQPSKHTCCHLQKAMNQAMVALGSDVLFHRYSFCRRTKKDENILYIRRSVNLHVFYVYSPKATNSYYSYEKSMNMISLHLLPLIDFEHTSMWRSIQYVHARFIMQKKGEVIYITQYKPDSRIFLCM